MLKILNENWIKKESILFYNFVKENSIFIIPFLFFSFLAYRIPLTQLTLSIDEEKAMFSDSISNDWVSQGRFGIILIKWFFNYWYVNSITAAFLGVFCLAVSGLIWAYQLNSVLSENIDKKKYAASSLLAILLFFTFPAYAENMGFSIMNFELGIGWILTSLSVVLVFKGLVKNSGKSYIVTGIVFLMLCISIYQSFLPVFILGMIASFLIHAVSSQKDDVKINVKEVVVYVFKFSLVGIMSLVMYKLIDKIIGFYIPPSGYISNFFAWNVNDIGGSILKLLSNFRQIVVGDIVYGSLMILFGFIFSLIVLMIYIYKFFSDKENRGKNTVVLLLVLVLAATPFLMPILLGAPVPIRVNLNFSLFVAIAWFLLYCSVKNKGLKFLLILLVLWGSFYQSLAVSRLFYSDYNRYEEDKGLAAQLNDRISTLAADENSTYPVVYIGQHTQEARPNIIKQEVLGYSFFEWDGGNPIRMRNFMNSLGYEFLEPSSVQIEEGKKLSLDMPSWPASGSVAVKKEMIIVKLSEDPSNYALNLVNDPERKIEKSAFSHIGFTNMTYNYAMREFKETSKGIKIVSTDADPQASFSLNTVAEKDSFDYIRLIIESDTEGDLQLFLAEEEGMYSGRFNGTVLLKKGVNVIYCDRQRLMREVKSMRIDPPDNSTITLKSIEFYK